MNEKGDAKKVTMMRKTQFLVGAVTALAFTIVLTGCGSDVPRSAKEARKALASKEGGIVDSFESKALAGNELGESATRSIMISLPPSYYAEGKRHYPVCYFLHGHSAAPGFIFQNRKYIAKLMADGKIPEMILVEPDGTTRFGGGFYSNSPMTGNYEDYLTGELVAFIDANYRTIPSPGGRAIAGFSMGGFGALARAFAHPDVYGAVYAYGPGVLEPETGLSIAMDAWNDDAQFLSAYASVFSPTPGAKKPGNVPKLDGSPGDAKIVADWNAGFGDWERKLDAYLAGDARLRAIKFGYGITDEYRFIREGCEYLTREMTAKGIAHDFFVGNAGHVFRVSQVVEDMLPYLGSRLEKAGDTPAK